MPEWVVEEGIGERRALLIDREKVLAAKLFWPGELQAGEEFGGKLLRKAGSRGMALHPSGREVLVDGLPREASEGASYRFILTRAAMTERGRFKLGAARSVESAGRIAANPFADGAPLRQLPAGAWDDIWQTASSGAVEFAGGSLLFATTPAMTLIDIDGELSPRELALAAVPEISRWLPLFDLGGSIGVDFPTLQTKADRKAVDEALDDALADFPHERTAMNGFGFVQIVARLEGPSLLHRFATSRVGMAARMALHRAEMVEGPGVTQLTVHPALKARLKPEWLAELERRTARPVRILADPGLAIEAATAQIVAHDD
ncbi:ribonuclease E/G [Qipengyuania qiaonensis]|uniref:Ribonuclease E/G n=1 Tax=Qipengyuania qiaonensis TaxID=2867240 RepID=A0ABS7JB00_9SPHN|nr:ribonuclease E/G [Qipengyuania qiaonensis]MBX7483135.1 ribonuclease E/G [Qipengyuania qiaonensis]